MPARVPAIAVLALAIAPILAGCGSSSDEPARTTGTVATAADPAPQVSVLSSTVRVSPARAGSPEHPKGVVVHTVLRLRQPVDVDPPLAKTAELRLSAGTRFDGEATAACPLATVERGGAAACPELSHIGMGSVVGLADTAKASGDVQVVNGGSGHVYLATTISNPVVAKGVVRGDVTSGDDGVVIKLTFPESLQTVAGVPLGLTRFELDIGQGTVLSTTGCPSGGRWSYDASVGFEGGGMARRSGAVRCS